MLAARPDLTPADSGVRLTAVRERMLPTTFQPRPGDIVFGNRLSWTQMCKNVSGDQWTHVAVVTEGDELEVVELAPKGCGTRSLVAFGEAYRYIGFARTRATTACVDRMQSWAKERVGVDFSYSWAHFAVAGTASVARRFGPRRHEPAINRVSRRAADWADRRQPGASVCSSFIWDCLAQACPACRPRLGWPTRSPITPWRARPTVTDVVDDRPASGGREEPDDRAARLLANPSDLWMAGNYELRIVIDGDRAVALTDHTDPPASQPCLHRPELSVVGLGA